PRGRAAAAGGQGGARGARPADRLRRRARLRRPGRGAALTGASPTAAAASLHHTVPRPTHTEIGVTRMAHSEQEILTGLAEIVNEETGLPVESVQPDKSFTDDLDIDSLSMMTIVTLAEEKFEVRIPDEEVANLTTVQDAVSFIQNAQQAWPTRPRRHPGPPRPTTPEEHTLATPTVVITGLGATTPLGGDVPSTWSAALAGKSGVRTLDNDWAERYEIPVDF